MAGVDEAIVREYFELNGFLVRQVRKYQVHSRAKRAEEEIDLIIYNPTFQNPDRSPNFMLFSNDLKYIQRGIVSIKAWHSHTFTPSTLKGSADIVKFLEKDVVKRAEELFNLPEKQVEPLSVQQLTKILVLPGIPTHEPHKSESTKLLQEAGVDAIISFRAMLQDIIDKLERSHNYSKSEILQLLRIMKNYDMIKAPQMELFKGGKR